MSMPNPLSRYEFRAFIFSRFPRCSVYVSESKRSKIRNWSTRPSYKVLAALPEGGKMSHRECGRGAARAWPLRRRTDEETKAVESGYVLTISLRTLLFRLFCLALFVCWCFQANSRRLFYSISWQIGICIRFLG